MANGTASVLLNADTLRYIIEERSDEVEVISHRDFGDGLAQVYISHSSLPRGYNGQVELSFKPWPHGDIHIRRDADT